MSHNLVVLCYTCRTIRVFKSHVINATRQIFPDSDIALIGTDSNIQFKVIDN